MDEQRILDLAQKHKGDSVEFANAILAAHAESAEPVAWMIQHEGKCMGFLPWKEENTVPVYIHPHPQSADVAELVEALKASDSWYRSHANLHHKDIDAMVSAALAKHGGKK